MLELKNIGKTFNPGTVNEKIALEGVNLHLDDGDFATIVGSNGAGKSTLFNAIAGEFIADTGTITLAGKDITFLPDYKRSKAIGRMFQDPLRGTAPHMTIEENLALAFLRASGHTSPFSRITKKDRDLFAEKLSELGLGLEDRMKQPVGLGRQGGCIVLAAAQEEHRRSTYGVEDWVPGIQFQLVDTFATYYEGWNRRAWGPICLPEPAVTLGAEE